MEYCAGLDNPLTDAWRQNDVASFAAVKSFAVLALCGTTGLKRRVNWLSYIHRLRDNTDGVVPLRSEDVVGVLAPLVRVRSVEARANREFVVRDEAVPLDELNPLAVVVVTENDSACRETIEVSRSRVRVTPFLYIPIGFPRPSEPSLY